MSFWWWWGKRAGSEVYRLLEFFLTGPRPGICLSDLLRTSTIFRILKSIIKIRVKSEMQLFVAGIVRGPVKRAGRKVECKKEIISLID